MKSLIFTYLLTYGGSLVAVFNPYIGLLIYVLFAIVQPPVIWWYAVPVGNYARIIAVALLVGWVLQNTGSWSFGKAKVSVWLLVGFLFWMTLSTLFAASPNRASFFLEIQAKIVLPFIVGMTLIDTPAKLKQLAWVIVASTGYLGYELNMQYLDSPNRLYFHGFGALDNNGVAVTMVTGAAIAFFLGSEDDSIWRRWFAFILAGLQVHVILFSQSRGGMLALVIMAVVCALLLLIRPKVTRSLTYMAMALVIGMALAGPSVWERFNSIFVEPEQRDASAVSRLDLWTACYQLMLDEPLFGIGPNHFPMYSSRFGFTAGKASHTTWLNAGAENGFPGFVLLLGFFVYTSWKCFVLLWKCRTDPRYRESMDPFCQSACTMTVASLSGYMVAAQFVSLQLVELPYYVAMLGAGALKLASLPNSAQQSQPVRPERLAGNYR